MEYRNIFVANPARLSVRNNQLVIEQSDVFTVPLEDISAVLIESQQVVLTVHAAAALAENSELNNFNLADDLIEPFRPVVDLFVAQHYSVHDTVLTSAQKIQLFNLTNYLVSQAGKNIVSCYRSVALAQLWQPAYPKGHQKRNCRVFSLWRCIAMNNRLMRILVMFDLPVKTKAERRVATQFRNFLVKDGYHMVQYSVYARICNGRDSVEVHRKRILTTLPSKGSVRMLIITEKQYNAIELLVGKPTPYDKPQQFEQLMIF